jgi:hypothetical protein
VCKVAEAVGFGSLAYWVDMVGRRGGTGKKREDIRPIRGLLTRRRRSRRGHVAAVDGSFSEKSGRHGT